MQISAESHRYTINKENFFRNKRVFDSSDDDSMISIDNLNERASILSTQEGLSAVDQVTKPQTELTSVKTLRTNHHHKKISRVPGGVDVRRSFFLSHESYEESIVIFNKKNERPKSWVTSISGLLGCFGSCAR